MRRRALLAALGTGIVGASYLARGRIAPTGRITRRAITGVVRSQDGSLEDVTVLRELLVDGDPPEVVIDVQSEFRDAFATDRSNTVDTDLHDRLKNHFEGGVRYRIHQFCGGERPASSPCGRAQLSRTDFNDVQVAADVRLLSFGTAQPIVIDGGSAPSRTKYRPHPDSDG